MAIIYTVAVKNARLDAVTAQIGATGVLEIGTTGMGTILATINLPNPAAPAASGGVLTFTMPQSDLSADNTGIAAAARIRTASGGTDIITGLTVGTSGADVIVDNVNFAQGQRIDVNSATITHA